MPISEPGPVYTPRARWLPWRLRWWVERRRRRNEESRLYSIACATCDDDDYRAWRELKAENRLLGVWQRR
jgi:hypothetical protein